MAVASLDQSVKIGNNGEFEYEMDGTIWAVCLRTFLYSWHLGLSLLSVVSAQKKTLKVVHWYSHWSQT